MKKLLKSLALVAVFGVVFYAVGALAQNNNNESGGMSQIVDTLATLFDDVRTVFYVLGAFGLIGMAAAALLGKIQWKWLFALVFGIAIVAAADYIVSYASTGGSDTSGKTGTTDDLWDSEE